MSKQTTIDQLKMLAQRTKTEIDKVDGKVTALSSRVDTLASTQGEVNILTAVKNNGTALEIVDKAVDIGPAVATAVAASDHLGRKKVASLDAIDLTAADAGKYVYMVPKEGGKNGDKYNEYMVLDGALEPVGDWAVDLSGYQPREEGKGLSSNDYTAAEKEKLAGIEMATDTEVDAMLTEVFGAAAA